MLKKRSASQLVRPREMQARVQQQVFDRRNTHRSHTDVDDTGPCDDRAGIHTQSIDAWKKRPMQFESNRHAVRIDKWRQVVMAAVQLFSPGLVNELPTMRAAHLPRGFGRSLDHQQVDVRHRPRSRARDATSQQGGPFQRQYLDADLLKLLRNARYE
jgi:hypothetical protein